jgi:hypothetical protein
MLALDSYRRAWGGRMRNLLILMVATLCLGFSLGRPVRAQNSNRREQVKQLKIRQKLERKNLKVQEKNRRLSFKHQPISKASRLQAKHQMQRERREMRAKQRDEKQDLKDSRKVLTERQRAYGQ